MNWESFFYGFVSGFMFLFIVVMATLMIRDRPTR